jgi:heme-degrading monooxygenase HmoA
MITTANRIFVHSEYADQFEQTFRSRAGLVDHMPGFVSNQLLRPVNPDEPYIVLTVWESRAHFEHWVRSDEFRQGHARSGSLPEGTFSGPNKLELYEIILDSSRPELVDEPRGGPFHPHG